MSMGEEVTGDQQMKSFISATDELLAYYARITQPQAFLTESIEVVEEEPSTPIENPMLEECRELVLKMRTFTEDASGEYALGVETGMQRAADMIENLIRRHEKGNE